MYGICNKTELLFNGQCVFVLLKKINRDTFLLVILDVIDTYTLCIHGERSNIYEIYCVCKVQSECISI